MNRTHQARSSIASNLVSGAAQAARCRPRDVGTGGLAPYRIVLTFGVLLGVASTVAGQGNGAIGGNNFQPRGYPGPAYYAALRSYRDGDLETAADLVETAARSGRRDINGRWIDAIPSLALQAELLWQLGYLEPALASIDEAMAIAVRYRGWLGRLDHDALGRPTGVPATQINLWPAAANLPRLAIPDDVLFSSGEILTEQRLAAGGVIEAPIRQAIDAAEIMRGLASAQYRRGVMLGELNHSANLPRDVLEATKYPPGLADGVGRQLIGALRGVGYFGVGEYPSVNDRAGKYAVDRRRCPPADSAAADGRHWGGVARRC